MKTEQQLRAALAQLEAYVTPAELDRPRLPIRSMEDDALLIADAWCECLRWVLGLPCDTPFFESDTN